MLDDEASFAQMLEALRPWNEQIVIVGGWVHRLHRVLPDAIVPRYAPIVTRDADMALQAQRMSGNIAVALKNAGFTQRLSSDHAPPVSRYTLGDDAGFYVEFLSPRRGNGLRRDGSEDATVAVAGVTAQRLRHLNVLLVAPWRLEPGVRGAPANFNASVLVANPVSFVVQKLLIHDERRPRKKAQDILYLNDTAELLSSSIERLRLCWKDQVEPTLTRRQQTAIAAGAANIFGAVNDTIRDAA